VNARLSLTATSAPGSASDEDPNQRLASSPVEAFSPASAAMRSSAAKAKASAPRASTRQAAAPLASASPTNWRASKA